MCLESLYRPFQISQGQERLGISSALDVTSIAAVWWPDRDGETKCRDLGLSLSDEVFVFFIDPIFLKGHASVAVKS